MTPSSSAKKKATEADQPEAKTDDGCKHHWVIDPPNGAVSNGRCKACGEEREFRNSFEYSSWYGNKSPGAKGGAKGADAKAGNAKPADAKADKPKAK